MEGVNTPVQRPSHVSSTTVYACYRNLPRGLILSLNEALNEVKTRSDRVFPQTPESGKIDRLNTNFALGPGLLIAFYCFGVDWA